jgi:hypothetical protein
MTEHYYRLRDYALNHPEQRHYAHHRLRYCTMEKQLPLFAYELTASAQQTIREALALLERQLREPGASFTSSSSVRLVTASADNGGKRGICSAAAG